ncbi:MAG TPA: hypothetical protein VL096_18110 [Pirellulaceae bacterium]|nr:hypothetical protein [Pirellulaceae bacterium]
MTRPEPNWWRGRPVTLLTTLALGLLLSTNAIAAEPTVKNIAVITTSYYHNSHADVIASRLLKGYSLDGQPPFPRLKLVSLYTDQVPKNDISRRLAEEFKFPIYDSVADALTLKSGKLAVDGVLLIAEHGSYPESETGQIVYPKRRLFEQICKVFDESKRVVPVFSDKHLADNWADAKWIYDNATERKIPLMAGSSLPGLWRYPAADVERNWPLQEIVAVSYHRLDTYGFHALEMVQCLAEQRRGGESGIKSVRCLSGEAAWQAFSNGTCSRALLNDCFARLKERPLPKDKRPEELCPRPDLFIIDYHDGLRASVLTWTHDWHLQEWAAAWRYADKDESAATCFWTQEARPFQHFGFQLQGIEQMFHTGTPSWPAERTLLTSGALDALLISKRAGGRQQDCPELAIKYQSAWRWQEPPPPPKNRPLGGE